jgi:hypothetical protein
MFRLNGNVQNITEAAQCPAVPRSAPQCPKAAHQFNRTIYLLDSKPRPVLPLQLSRSTIA